MFFLHLKSFLLLSLLNALKAALFTSNIKTFSIVEQMLCCIPQFWYRLGSAKQHHHTKQRKNQKIQPLLPLLPEHLCKQRCHRCMATKARKGDLKCRTHAFYFGFLTVWHFWSFHFMSVLTLRSRNLYIWQQCTHRQKTFSIKHYSTAPLLEKKEKIPVVCSERRKTDLDTCVTLRAQNFLICQFLVKTGCLSDCRAEHSGKKVKNSSYVLQCES